MPLSGAHANAGEWKVSVGLGVANTSVTLGENEESELLVTAPILELSCFLALTDYWQAGVTVNGGPTFGSGDETSQSFNVNLEGRFVLDALTWVPYLSFGIGGWTREQTDGGSSQWREDMSVFGGFGIDYRPSRDWSAGFLARGHAVFTGETQPIGPFDAQVLVSLYFD